MATTISMDDNIIKRIKNKVDDSSLSTSDLVNQYLLEKLDADDASERELSSQEIQALLSHDKPEGDNTLSDLEGAIDRGPLLMH